MDLRQNGKESIVCFSIDGMSNKREAILPKMTGKIASLFLC